MYQPRFVALAIATVLFVSLVGTYSADALEAADVYPTQTDPFVGNWVGRWTGEEDVDPDIAAQVIPLGRDKYRIRITAKLDMRATPKTEVEVARDGDALSFKDGSLYGEIREGLFTGGKGRGERSTFEMKKVEMLSPTLGEKAPEGAVVLFDGSGFDAWQDPTGWELLDDGVMMVTPKGSYLVSKQNFGDAKLHAEFRLPFQPKQRGQARGNSGVFLQDTYEVQVLDSYGLEGYYDECGALYKVSAPRVNACRPPLQWQTYDITYAAPRFDASGKQTAHPRMTVYHNGVLIQKDVEMPWITGWKEKGRLGPAPSEPGPVKLQGHGNYLQFRNIWVLPLPE